MSRWDIAEWRGPTPNQGGRMLEQRGLVVHIAEGTYEGTISWQKNPAAQVSSHFVVGVDGRIAQCVDSDVTAWTQRDGNGHWLSVENAGHTPSPLTAAQVEANARLLAYGHKLYGYPLALAGSPSGRGLGYHSMGAEAGANWGHPDCPGPAIKAQLPAILARAVEIAGGSPQKGEAWMASVEDIVRFEIRSWTEATLQAVHRIEAAQTAERAVIDQLAAAITKGGGSVDTAAILAGVDERLAALAAAQTVEVRDAVADLGEGGAAQVRLDA